MITPVDAPGRPPYIYPDMAQPDTTSPATRPWLWWAIALGTILLGYADLARGGMTIAPILLVAGYCVLVPVAIVK
ncbi:MAG: hypothetical protein JWL60_2450 [Gemmatimonadetes bacterium]|jgi:hypothetical protein|nr:hypothetical protein [Gemmatimonadota bacterium]